MTNMSITTNGKMASTGSIHCSYGDIAMVLIGDDLTSRLCMYVGPFYKGEYKKENKINMVDLETGELYDVDWKRPVFVLNKCSFKYEILGGEIKLPNVKIENAFCGKETFGDLEIGDFFLDKTTGYLYIKTPYYVRSPWDANTKRECSNSVLITNGDGKLFSDNTVIVRVKEIRVNTAASE